MSSTEDKGDKHILESGAHDSVASHDDNPSFVPAFVSTGSVHDWVLCLVSAFTAFSLFGLMIYWAGFDLSEVEPESINHSVKHSGR